MSNLKTTLLLLILLGSNHILVSGQDVKAKKNHFVNQPIEFAFGNFSVGMPFSKLIIREFYPMVSVGTEFYYREKEHSQFYQTAKLGGFYSAESSSAIFLNTETGWRYNFGFGLFADAALGIGYTHLFRPNAIYKLNENGEYEQVADWGKPGVMADFSFSVGYSFTKRWRNIHVFLRYADYVQVFYNKGLPVLPQNSVQLGVKFHICQNHE